MRKMTFISEYRIPLSGQFYHEKIILCLLNSFLIRTQNEIKFAMKENGDLNARINHVCFIRSCVGVSDFHSAMLKNLSNRFVHKGLPFHMLRSIHTDFQIKIGFCTNRHA